MGTPAKVLAPAEVRRLQVRAERGRHALRNQVIVMLSFKAGLRAGEIAGLDWAMVLAPGGKIGPWLTIASEISKYRRGRRIPLNSSLKGILDKLHREQGRPIAGPVVRSQRGGKMASRSVVNWFAELYTEAGLNGCSSHSGRRTFITQTARLLAKAGGSLRDVQELAGHRSIATTERYIEGDRDAQRRLVRLL